MGITNGSVVRRRVRSTKVEPNDDDDGTTTTHTQKSSSSKYSTSSKNKAATTSTTITTNLGSSLAFLAQSTMCFLWQILMTTVEGLCRPLYDFLHARTGLAGCRLAGYMRWTFALLFTFSRLWMAYPLGFLFDPHTGVIPYSVTRGDMDPEHDVTIFQYAPESRLLVYGLFGMAILQGLLLFLGVAPRWQAVGIYVFLGNLYNHNGIMFDNQEHMLRMWAFFLCWLPLDHVTIYDGFGGWIPWFQEKITAIMERKNTRQSSNDSTNPTTTTTTSNTAQSSSWPMWPFRLWQIYICFIYAGAGFGKLATGCWQDGTALFYIWYEEGSLKWVPPLLQDWLFNRLFFVKLQTWISLALECICIITIWPTATRKLTFVAIVILHIGIEMALDMHIFEYISVLGWICFFVKPEKTTTKTEVNKIEKDSSSTPIDDTTDRAPTSNRARTVFRRGVLRFLETIVAVGLLALFAVDSIPIHSINQFMPPPLPDILMEARTKAFDAIHPFMTMTWLHVG